MNILIYICAHVHIDTYTYKKKNIGRNGGESERNMFLPPWRQRYSDFYKHKRSISLF